jgi:hypothetical protein
VPTHRGKGLCLEFLFAGLLELPPGVELPDNVNELLKKALRESGNKKPPPTKKPAPKKATPEGDKAE